MNHDCDWRSSREADRLEAIGRLLRTRFDQIAAAPAPPVLIALAERLETRIGQSAKASDA